MRSLLYNYQWCHSLSLLDFSIYTHKAKLSWLNFHYWRSHKSRSNKTINFLASQLSPTFIINFSTSQHEKETTIVMLNVKASTFLHAKLYWKHVFSVCIWYRVKLSTIIILTLQPGYYLTVPLGRWIPLKHSDICILAWEWLDTGVQPYWWSLAVTRL